MTRAQQFRRQAEECLELAEQSRLPAVKASFLRIAQDWYQLALNAERNDPPKDEEDRD